jgi:Tfp pilus assembly protein PilN
MRAINLIPEQERRGAGGAAGRSGGAAFVLLGLLAVMVAVVAAYTLQHRMVVEKRSELARTEAHVAQNEALAGQLASYVQFAALRVRRTQTVAGLAASRFDWAHSLREVARVIPSDAWLTSMQGTVAPGVTLKAGGAGAVGGLRSAIASPAIELVGCATGQDAVAGMLTRMRLVDGVSRVAMQSSVKGDLTKAGSGAGPSGDCRRGRARYPQFALVIFFDRAAGAVPTAAPGARRVVAPSTGLPGPTGPTGATP